MKIGRPGIFIAVCSLAMLMAVSAASGENNKAQWKGAAPNSEDSFRFVVMGDNTGVPIPGEWEEAIREVNLLKPDFVMSVGDFIGPGTWEAFDAEIRKLNAPFYYCPGNHDIVSPATKDLWLVRYGVDGKSGDWRNVKKYELKSKYRLVGGGPDAAWKYWNGEQDLSALMYLGHDSQRLYVCLDVTDDQMAIDGKDCWDNDGVEFFWDSRSADKQNGKHGLGTGQVILSVPPERQAPALSWFMGSVPSGFTGNRPIPKDFVAAMTRRPGGYTYEFSVPLSELGVKTPVMPGETVNLELMVNDRDLVNGQPTWSHIDTSSYPGAYDTKHYAHCTFK